MQNIFEEKKTNYCTIFSKSRSFEDIKYYYHIRKSESRKVRMSQSQSQKVRNAESQKVSGATCISDVVFDI